MKLEIFLSSLPKLINNDILSSKYMVMDISGFSLMFDVFLLRFAVSLVSGYFIKSYHRYIP